MRFKLSYICCSFLLLLFTQLSWADKNSCINSSRFFVENHLNNNESCLYYQDSKIRAIINCRTNACNLQQVAINKDGLYINTFYGSGYWWGASPKGVADGEDGWAQTTDYSNRSYNKEDVNFEILYFPWGIKISWYQNIHTHRSHKAIGIASWGAYDIPYETGFIKVWNRFQVEDIDKHLRLYQTNELGSFSANLDVRKSFSDVFWPSMVGDVKNSLEEDYGLHTYSILSGDWNQPNASGSHCSAVQEYEMYPYLGHFHRDMREARCHDHINANDPINMAWGTTVEATHYNDPDAKPYMMHYDPRHQLGVVRLLSSEENRRKTIQVFDNGGFYAAGEFYSSGISWDWGDDNFENWPHSGFTATQLEDGVEVTSQEELWFGVGSMDEIKSWVNYTHPVY